MAKITYEEFKNLLEFVPYEPEFEFYFEHTSDSYMLIKYAGKVSFCRCGLSEDAIKKYGNLRTIGSVPEEFESFEELYRAKVVDGICLKDDWEKIDVICLNGTFNLPAELSEVYEVYEEFEELKLKEKIKKAKKPIIDFGKLRNGEEVRCPECKEGIFRTNAKDPKTAHHFRCDKCGMMINYD